MPRRVLVLGSTGVDKRGALDNFRIYRSRITDISDLLIVDFERDFIETEVNLYDYLDAREDHQRAIWRSAWRKFQERLRDHRHKDILLSMHGVLVRPLYGVRTPANIDDLKQFETSSIITLIDDVYTQWARTEQRARGLDWKGRPTLEQLLFARRAEVFFGDIVANHVKVDGRLQNYIIAARHPARVLERLVFGPSQLKTVYLSFPISGPREQADAGIRAGIDEVNGFLRRVADFERAIESCINNATLSAKKGAGPIA